MIAARQLQWLLTASLCLAQAVPPSEHILRGCLIYERPAGLIDGRNGTFTLSRLPNTVSTIDLFKMGLRLQPGTDYKRVGQVVVILGSAIPKPNDVLTAVYSVCPAPRALPDIAEHVMDVSAVGGDIIERLLREALRRELKRASPTSSTQDAHAPRSVQMLRDRSVEKNGKNHTNKDGGFDGLGDESDGTISTGSKFLEMLSERGRQEGHNR